MTADIGELVADALTAFPKVPGGRVNGQLALWARTYGLNLLDALATLQADLAETVRVAEEWRVHWRDQRDTLQAERDALKAERDALLEECSERSGSQVELWNQLSTETARADAAEVAALKAKLERAAEALGDIAEFNSGEDTTLGALHRLAEIRNRAAAVYAELTQGGGNV